MKVTAFSCGPAANESELKAFEHLKSCLQSAPGSEEWILLRNLAFSVTHQLQSDEIDIVVIGPPGVRILEIKHWNSQWVDSQTALVEKEADRVTNKARKIGTTLRKLVPHLPHVQGAILLTEEPSRVKQLAGKEVRGVRFHTLADWKAAIGFNSQPAISPREVRTLGQALEPKSAVALDGSLRRLAGYVNLELQTPKDDRFHRVYKGIHSTRQDQVVLHLYDLSASDEKNPTEKARREYEVLHRLQRYDWAPRILDSYQDAPGYAGEMSFFTVVDPAAPSIDRRASDTTWTTESRVAFARKVVRALADLHSAGSGEEPLIHRNLTPKTILVRHDNTPILVGFHRARIPSAVSVNSSGLPSREEDPTVAPEVCALGLSAADHRSDIYSLCASLTVLFKERGDDLSCKVLGILEKGLTEEPEQRSSLEDLEQSLAQLLGESVPRPPAPPARFWTEGQVVRFHDFDYRIIARLGSGGVGATFKVVQLDQFSGEELGTYVAKVVHQKDAGKRVLRAYSLARSHVARHPGLSAILEPAKEWRENEIIALMSWVEGTPLGEFTGVFPLLAEDQQECSAEALALRWVCTACEALGVLHRNSLIHGDVSPRNMIVSGGDLVLTDYDFVTKIGEPVFAPGTVLYCSPSCQDRRAASPADDIYALAASFFHVVFAKEPFRYGGVLAKERGLNWEGVEREDYPVLADFLDRATHPDPQQRFASVGAALTAIRTALGEAEKAVEPTRDTTTTMAASPPKHPPTTGPGTELHDAHVEWLLCLLQSYPGSRWGNRETRGLDTEFAAETYVPTTLEDTLYRDIQDRRVRLVILCGNAGDGKTALLQHLARRLGLGEHPSAQRVLEGSLPDGLRVRMNLDGSAAWQGRSADEILDAFLEPFQDGPPRQDCVHLLAINDGRLLEWIEGVEERRGGQETPLTRALYAFLQQEVTTQEQYIRFINLNRRSLVGGVTGDHRQIETTFLERLIDQLYGGQKAAAIWDPCRVCSARERCEVMRAARIFGPDSLPDLADAQVRVRARQRLFAALQAVHLRGETHITVRELRAALVYILFGVHYCDEYHEGPEEMPQPYWDRAFAADSLGRQGDVLRELAQFDPALESHPQIDRHLLSKPASESHDMAPHYHQISLASARRRAYFEWTTENIEQIAGDPDALDLARGQHLRLFRELALAGESQRLEVCRRLCTGISRLEDLPPQALDRPGVVPLRITPRTPTETAFWVEKPLSSFRLEADLPSEASGVERLHRQAYLIYRYRDGNEERLRLGAELFHLLLELSDGYQLGDVSTDDAFAHLSIFVQRLIREDEREMLAWNPMNDEVVYQVSAVLRQTDRGPEQRIILSPIVSGCQK